MSRYMKALAAMLGSVATWGVTAGADGGYDQVELWGLLGVVAATLATYAATNSTPAGKAPDPNISETGPYV